jgi:Domain of unknown function (DUF4338)/Transposase Tn5 dimerisation domain/Transposase DNA-binding
VLEGVYRGGATDLGELGSIEIVLVHSRRTPEHRQWTALLSAHHYLGAGPLCGAQIRYLIRCREGLLGALAFSACARRLGVRDRWIGWSEAARRANLQQVVSNSRFLLVPRIQNLASHVLSRATARLAEDFQSRYGIRPVLVESFVDRSRFDGACYRASNWTPVGWSAGRGRQDRHHEKGRSAKEVFLHALEEEFRQTLCVEPVEPLVEDQEWAESEFGRVKLPDERLRKRLVSIAKDFFARPTANIPQACGSRAKAKAVYRFCSHKAAKMETVLEPHYDATVRRCSKEKVVLAVQDTTTLSYTTHTATEGLGPTTNVGTETLGLLLHSTMAFNVQGTPLGLLNAQCWARDAALYGQARERMDLPVAKKESKKWLVGYEATLSAQRRLKETRVVNVADREADMFELFVEARKSPGSPDLLVRATHPRAIELEGGKGAVVWEHVRSLPLAGQLPLRVPKRKSRPARDTTLGVRFSPVTVCAPKKGPGRKLEPVSLWAIVAEEENSPEGQERIEWLLLTTVPVNTIEDAAEKLHWYTLRWQIEVYHRTLKSGCRIENRQLASAHSLKVCVAVDMVVAWRVFHLARLGREIPNVPCTVFFEEAQWQALVCFLKRTPVPPKEAPPLGEAMRMVATLGGFLGRKSDGNPGTQTIWLGLQRLDDIAATFAICTGRTPPDTS